MSKPKAESAKVVPEAPKLDLPDEWEIVPVEKVVLRTSQTDPTRTPEMLFQYVDVSSVSNTALAIDTAATSTYKGADAPSRARKVIQADDVIFATIRPNLKRIARVPRELD